MGAESLLLLQTSSERVTSAHGRHRRMDNSDSVNSKKLLFTPQEETSTSVEGDVSTLR